MPTSPSQAKPSSAPAFSPHLKAWRHRERLSQLELSLHAGVSQRHLSHLESGRSQPSRSMVLLLGQALRVPLREQNEALLAAGYAPAFRASELDRPDMAPILEAVEHMLTHHAPYPAVAIDREWNVCRANAPFRHLMALLQAPGSDLADPGAVNLMRLFFQRGGIRPWVANWNEVAPLLWQRACREAQADGTGRVQAILDPLKADLGAEPWVQPPRADLIPVLPLVLSGKGLTLSLFSVIATFGTAQDVTTDELRIECFFPADQATRILLEELARRGPDIAVDGG